MTTPRARRYSIIVSIAAVLSMVPFPLLTDAPVARAQTGTGPSAQRRVEIPHLRTQTSRTYFEHGMYIAQLFPGSINYQDSHGAWQPIDNTLVPSTRPGDAYQNKANRYTASFPSSLGTAPIHVETTAGSIDFSLPGASGPAAVSGASIQYSLPGATLAYTAGNDLLKESLTLQNVSAPSSYTFQVHTHGLTAQPASNGGVNFVDGNGKLAFSFAPPSMQDSNGVTSRAVSLKLASSPTEDTVTLAADPAWLAAPSRAWPVVIDPTIVFSINNIDGASQDCTISPAGSNCTGTTLQTGWNGTNPYRSLLLFNLSSIPSKSTIVHAELGLYSTAEQNTTAVSLSAYPMTRAWTNAASWSTYNGTNAWTTAGGDYSGTATASATAGGTTGNWSRWYPTPLVQNWVNGTTPNDGLILKEPTENANNVLSFDSSEASTSSDWPYLQVAYSQWLGQRGFYPMVSGQVDDRLGYGVNLANGNLVLQATDFSMPGIGLPLTIGRTYNSQFGGMTDAGQGWVMDSGADVALDVFTDGSLGYSAPGGYAVGFTKNADGSFTTPPGIDATMAENSDGSYTLTDNASGLRQNFTSAGLLTSLVDRSGNTITFNSAWSGVLQSITDTQGRTTSISYDPNTNQISQITDPAGRTSSYTYDSFTSELLTATDPAGKVTQFTYSSTYPYPLTQITDPNGNSTTFAYDTTGRLTSLSQVLNSTTSDTTSFAYNSGNTVVTDPNGHATTYAYDIFGRGTAVTDALGNTARVTWTADDQPASGQTPSGGTTTYSYDSRNNLTQVTPPAGNPVKAAYGNSTFPYQPSSTTDAQGNTTIYGYNSQGLLTSSTDPAGHSSSATYNGNGTMASATDENGHTTSYAYTSSGMPSVDTPPSPLGTTSYAFTTANQESSVTDGNGKVTTFTYDSDGRVTAVGYADNTSIIYTYDADGNVTSMVDSSGTTSYTYNALNQLTKETLPSGQSISYTYDAAGNLTGKTDSGGTVGYGYNQVDEVTSVTDRQNHAYSIGYDQNGNRTSIGFPNGVTERTTFNSDGQLTAITGSTSSATLTSFSYSYTNPTTNQQTGLPYSVTDTAARTTSYAYDNGNQLTSAVQKSSTGSQLASYGYGYDPAGNLTSKTVNGTGTTFSYNAANELTSASGGMSMTYSYDGNGDLTSRSDGTRISLNPAGQITSITPPSGTAIPMTYTGIGETQRIGNGSTSYQYDGTGLGKQTDSLGNTYFTSLPDGTLLSETVPSGSAAGTYYYLSDGAGSVAAVTNSSGAISDSYNYDPLGNATSSGTVPNPYTFGSASYDSHTGFYYTGSGYYDPATGQSFGCKDKGWVDPGEDLCGEDEGSYTYTAALHPQQTNGYKIDTGSTVRIKIGYLGHRRINVTVTVIAARHSQVTNAFGDITTGSTVCWKRLSGSPRRPESTFSASQVCTVPGLSVKVPTGYEISAQFCNVVPIYSGDPQSFDSAGDCTQFTQGAFLLSIG